MFELALFKLPWLTLLKLFLSAAANIAGYLKDKQLLNAGEAQQVAFQLTEVARQGGLSQQVRDAVANMTDAELDAELQGKNP